MKTYNGNIFDHAVSVTEASGRTRLLDPRLDIAKKSPNGFSWGYYGSGPSQLAIALCADVFDDDRASDPRVWLCVRDQLVATLEWNQPFTITEDDIRKVARIENVSAWETP